MTTPHTDAHYWDTEQAFARYEALRAHLPQAEFNDRSDRVDTLWDVAARYDAFILDAFGVLNIGERPIPGAVERIAALRAAGKAMVVLTNGAAQARSVALAKYRRLGFDFAPDEVVASRDIAAAALERWPETHLWAAITAPGAGFQDIARRVAPLAGNPALLERADGFLFLGSEGWSDARQSELEAALRARPRPVLVANPDIVAPRETGLSLEPGHYAYALAEATGQMPVFFGKPHGNAFEAALARLPAGIPPDRIAMVGDTLHTDVLGGRAAGVGTILIAAHGLFAGHDPERFIAASGIVPDVIARTT